MSDAGRDDAVSINRITTNWALRPGGTGDTFSRCLSHEAPLLGPVRSDCHRIRTLNRLQRRPSWRETHHMSMYPQTQSNRMIGKVFLRVQLFDIYKFNVSRLNPSLNSHSELSHVLLSSMICNLTMTLGQFGDYSNPISIQIFFGQQHE